MSPLFVPLVLLTLSGPESVAETPAEASAESSERRWRLHAEVAPLRLSSSSTPAGRSLRLAASVPGSLSVGVGRALGRYVIVGARLGGELGHSQAERTVFTMDGQQVGEQTTTSGSAWIAPYVEARWRPSRRLQPFVLAEGGMGVSSTRLRLDVGDGDPTTMCARAVGPMLGGRVGLHAFVLPRVSIDADLGVRHQWQRQRSRSSIEGISIVPPSLGDGTLSLMGTLGLSGWW